MAERQLKIVKLIEPELCLDCRFADRAKVENEHGEVQRMVYCRRLDCDNWETMTFQPAKNVSLEGEGF